MMTVPASVQSDLALLLSLQGSGVRAGQAFAAVRGLVSPPPDAATFDAGMDGLMARRYVRAADTRLELDTAGQMFLDSLAESAAAAGAGARAAYGRLTDAAWELLDARRAELPARYYRRRGDYAVYVVLLDRAVAAKERARAENPQWREERPFLYVGMTSQNPLGRFRSHKQGRKSSRFVRRFGICLLPELFDHLNPLDRSGAAALEIDLAVDLRAQGYGVMGVYEPAKAR